MTVAGIDVSSWQKTTPPLAGLGFVFARCSFGTNPDKLYAMHAANVRRAGLVLGAYHYWQDADPTAQATAILAALRASSVVPPDLIAIDLEGTGSDTTTAHTQVASIMQELRSAGFPRVGLYHSRDLFPSGFGDYRWVAEWGSAAPDIAWAFWQYSDSGGMLDLDRFAGSADDLIRLARPPMYAVETVTELAAPNPRTFTIAAGAVVNGYDPAHPGVIVKSYGPATAPSTAHADATVGVAWYDTASAPVPRGYPFLRVVDGALAGTLVAASAVTLDPAAPPPATISLPAIEAGQYEKVG